MSRPVPWPIALRMSSVPPRPSDALAHLAQAEMAVLIGRAKLTGIEAAAVVTNRDGDAAGRIHRQLHQNRIRARMLADIAQSLLDDAEQRQFVDLGQRILRAGDLQPGGHLVLIAKVAHQLRQRREEAQRVQVHRAQGKDGAAQVNDGGAEHGLQLLQGGAHAGGSRIGQVKPQRGLEAQPGQALRHPVVDLVGDAVALGVDGFRLAPALHLGRDVFHRDDHVAGVSRIGRGDDAHGKARAVPTLVRGFRRHRLALLDPLHDGQDGCPGIFGYQVGGRHACELGGRVAVDQLRPPGWPPG